MTIAPPSPFEIAARMFEPQPPRERRWTSPLEMAQALDKTVLRTPALNLINAALVEVAEGREDRLIVSMPPQEAKSSTISRWLPEWLLSEVDPEMRIIMISYADEIARRWGADVKRDFETFNGDDESIDLGIRLRADSRAAGRWQVEGHKGGMFCAGVAGSVTGRPADCVSGATRIVTPQGYIPIHDLHDSRGPLPLVLSFNHGTGRAEWRRVLATRAIADRPLVEVVTAAGRRLVCTPDHRIYIAGRGYVPAAELRPGDRLTTAGEGADQMRAVRAGVHEVPILAATRDTRRPSALFEGVPTRRVGHDADLRGVRAELHQEAVRGRESAAQGPHAVVLHEGVLPRVADRAGSAGRGGRQPSGGPGDRLDDPDGDRPAALLRPGGRGPLRRGEPATGVRWLREGSQVEVGRMSRVLAEGPRRNPPDLAVRPVRHGVHAAACRGREEEAARAGSPVLLARVRGAGAEERGPAVHAMRHADRIDGPAPALLLAGLPGRGARRAPLGEDQGVPAVRPDLSVQQRAAGLLRPDLRGHGPLGPDGRRGQLPLQGRQQLRALVPQDASADHGARREPLPGVRAGRRDGPYWQGRSLPVQVGVAGAPHQPPAAGQLAGEPDPDLRGVPHDAPQVADDTVSVVRELRGARDVVYDLHVEGNGNFFADEVLVHNCILIDDPIKDLEQAQSPQYRERFQRFWQGVAVPRLGPGAKVVLIQTRWHEQDAAGWLIENEGRRDQGGRWKVINIPAIAEVEPDPLGRKIGEPMISARGNRDWAAIRKSVGEYVWAALYQGRPAPAEGGLFKRLWWRFWTMAPQAGMASSRLDLGGRIILLGDCWRYATIDLAASTKTSADWTVVGAWAQTPDGDQVLLDMMRARVGEAEHFSLVRPLVQRWQLDTVFVEASQYETTLVKDATREGIPISPLQAEQDKFSRALPYSARCSGGRVWLPANAAFVPIWISEHASFPNGSHDDMVDVGSMGTRVTITKHAPGTHRLPQPPARHPEFPGRTDDVNFMQEPM